MQTARQDNVIASQLKSQTCALWMHADVLAWDDDKQ